MNSTGVHASVPALAAAGEMLPPFPEHAFHMLVTADLPATASTPIEEPTLNSGQYAID